MRGLELTLALLVLASSVQFFTVPAVDNDLWGHILFGQEILAERSLPTTNRYSYTAPNYPWINHEIFAECVLSFTYEHLGSPGLLGLRWVFGVATLSTLALISLRRGAGPLATALALVVAGSLTSYGYLSRPQIFTYLFLAVLWDAIDRFAQHPRSRAIWLAPLLIALWVNAHGGVLAGVGVLAVAAAILAIREERRAELTCIVALSVLALFANPYGTELPLFLLRDVTISRPISEWSPIPLFDLSNLQFKIVCLVAIAGWAVGGARDRLWEVLIVAAATVATFRHERHLPLFAVLATPHLAVTLHWVLAGVGATRPSHGAQHALTCALTLLVVFQSSASIAVHRRLHFGIAVPREAYPVDAVRFLRERGGQGNLAVPFGWGEYALWHLHRDWRVSIDGRYTTAYPPEVIDLAWRYMNGQPGWDRLLEGATVALTETRHATPGLLDRHPEWRLVYADGTARLYARPGALPDAEHSRVSPSPNSPSLFP